MTILQEAIKYCQHGFNVIPADTNKNPLAAWKKYQIEVVTENQIREWWERWPSANISLVTGELSNLFVIDTDTPEATQKIQDMIPENYLIPCQKTPRGGMHFFFSHISGIPNKAKIEEGIDIRTQGGVIMVSPSVNGNGKAWQWLPGLSILEVEVPSLPVTLEGYLKNLHLYYKESTFPSQQLSTLSTNVNNVITKGSRDDTLFHFANLLIKGGAKYNETLYMLEMLAQNCDPPFPINEVRIKIESAIKRAERKERNLTAEIREWVLSTSGVFLSTNVNKCLHLSTREDEKVLSVVLKRLCNEGLIEKYGNQRGCFRVREDDCKTIDWFNADDKAIDVKWPFEIETIVETMPKNVVVIAGEKNAGKTSFLLNFCLLNMGKEIHYFSSEMADSELKKRLKKFQDIPLKKWQEIDFRDRAVDFHDVIFPDAINIIDFLEIHEEFYKVSLFIRKIYEKLNKGICLIALQKNPGVDWGLGGARSVEKARLYLSVSKGILKILSGKNWAGDLNPDGLKIDFKLVQGAKFIQKSDTWYRDKT